MLTIIDTLTYALIKDVQFNMKYLRTTRGIVIGLAFLLAEGLFASLVHAQESKQVEIDIAQITKAFDAYFSSPTEKNAERALSALPYRIDDQIANPNRAKINIGLIFTDHIEDFSSLIRKGDRLALRIAFHLHNYCDGLGAEMNSAVIGESIVVMPGIFLEETLLFRKGNPRIIQGLRNFPDYQDLQGILWGYIDFDTFRPEIVRKEVSARIKALESVDRNDLLKFRDECLVRLRSILETLRQQKPNCPQP